MSNYCHTCAYLADIYLPWRCEGFFVSRRKTGHAKVDHYPDNCNYLDKDAREMRVFVNRPNATSWTEVVRSSTAKAFVSPSKQAHNIAVSAVPLHSQNCVVSSLVCTGDVTSVFCIGSIQLPNHKWPMSRVTDIIRVICSVATVLPSSRAGFYAALGKKW